MAISFPQIFLIWDAARNFETVISAFQRLGEMWEIIFGIYIWHFLHALWQKYNHCRRLPTQCNWKNSEIQFLPPKKYWENAKIVRQTSINNIFCTFHNNIIRIRISSNTYWKHTIYKWNIENMKTKYMIMYSNTHRALCHLCTCKSACTALQPLCGFSRLARQKQLRNGRWDDWDQYKKRDFFVRLKPL